MLLGKPSAEEVASRTFSAEVDRGGFRLHADLEMPHHLCVILIVTDFTVSVVPSLMHVRPRDMKVSSGLGTSSRCLSGVFASAGDGLQPTRSSAPS